MMIINAVTEVLYGMTGQIIGDKKYSTSEFGFQDVSKDTNYSFECLKLFSNICGIYVVF